jgi:hypothetical protein
MHEELWDETVVVRGGVMALVTVRESVDTGYEQESDYNLSFWGENGYSYVELLAVAPRPNGQIRLSTIGALRALGYDPFRSDPWPHVTVRFEAEPTDDELERLIDVFGEPIPNPSPGG